LDGGRGQGRGGGDPFGETTDPTLYVPRAATESALDALVCCVKAGSRPAALAGRPGIGKTLLLHQLAARVREELRGIYLPYASVGIADFCAWLLGLLGEVPAWRPEATLVARCRELHRDGEAVVALIDEANSMPLPTARTLGKLMEESGGALRAVLATTEDSRSSRVIAALGPDALQVRLTAPMDLAETAEYIGQRLARFRVPEETRERFDATALAWIHRLSGGIPRRVHEICSTLLDSPPADVNHNWWEERWLGAPIDELQEPAAAAPPLGEIAQLEEEELPEVLIPAPLDESPGES
jgi:type II secretory pathway predicted ATPase ExeA